MKLIKKIVYRKGAALIISLIFVLIFSALAVSMATMSGTNLQLADNQRKANRAHACAESGVDIIRFWLGHIYMPGTTQPEDRFSYLANFLQADLAENGISNITATYDGANSTIIIDDVTLDSSTGQSFSSQIQQTSNIDILQMDVTGSTGGIDRTIRVNYNFGTRAHTVFDYGVATKGALNLSGNILMNGANVELDAGVYIESEDANAHALSIIGNSSIAGDVHITNPDATVDLQGGQASIGGETEPNAHDHIFKGIAPTEFPVPEPNYFRHYVVENTYDPNNVLPAYDNVIIPAGTDPSFGTVTFRGVVFIEAPNIVTFQGNTTITGIIVGNGDLNDNSQTNRIDFLGTVDSHPVTDLPEEFGELKYETGTFLMAPGFGVSFGGNFETHLNGAIAANGIEFFGKAGGTIDGSVINYSGSPMTLSGDSDLFFNRSGTDQMPAGFGPEIILYYVPSSYSEVVL